MQIIQMREGIATALATVLEKHKERREITTFMQLYNYKPTKYIIGYTGPLIVYLNKRWKTTNDVQLKRANEAYTQ